MCLKGIKSRIHATVLLNEAVNSLNIRPNGIYIDGTFGGGGHSRLILSKLGKQGRLLAFDRDPQAITIAKSIDDPRFFIAHSLFSTLPDYIDKYQLIGKIDGILIDLGVSSLQLDHAERGFSFMRDGPLDMRMDPTRGQSASEWLKNSSESHIANVIKAFGEERYSKRIARAIFHRNRIKPITRTKELVQVIISAMPIKDKNKHPATRTFQAIRIFINNELEEIKSILQGALSVLSPHGRLSIISFHSLEDRIVKYFMRRHVYCSRASIDFPITDVQVNSFDRYQLRELYKYMPSKEEVINNPRARSSVLRVAEKRIND